MMMHFCQFVLLAVTILVAPISANKLSSSAVAEQWQDFKVQYGKSYATATEEAHRFRIFQDNLARAAEFNLKNPRATFGVTRFSDLDPLEFQRQYLGYRPESGHAAVQRMSRPVKRDTPNTNPNTTFDWRTSGAISAVKDQGQCGSCWAFSAVEGVESAWFLKNGNLPILSPQQVTDCDTEDTGCNGGELQTAFEYIERTGLTTEAAYPYTSGDSGKTGKCQKISSVAAKITGFVYATPPCNDSCAQQDESVLFSNVAVTGPSSVCVDAAPWQTYTGGIMGGGCSSDYNDLDHCVQLVGYNIKNQIPYWIVRNSWG